MKDLENLLRHPDELEVKDRIGQEEFDKVEGSQGENDPAEQVFDQEVDFLGLELDKILLYSFKEGRLHFVVRFKSGKECIVPYTALREDFPLETTEYIMGEVDE